MLPGHAGSWFCRPKLFVNDLSLRSKCFPLLFLACFFCGFFFFFFPQGEQSKMIGASGLLERKQNITGKFFALKKEENKAFEQKT